MVVKVADWINLEDRVPISVYDIGIEIQRFYDIMRLLEFFDDSELFDTLKDIQRANLHFSRAKNIMRNYLKPEMNKYIGENAANKESYKWLVDNIGRVDLTFSEMQKMFFINADNAAIMGRAHSKININSYYNFLMEAMESLIYYPLKNAYLNFISFPSTIFDKKKNMEVATVKDKELFIYLLFLEMHHAAMSLGAISRQENVTSKKGIIDSQPNSMPERIPTSLETRPLPLPELSADQIDEDDLFSAEEEDDYGI